MSPARKALPEYLNKYITEQNYDSYTEQEHAAWRFILRQNRAFFSKHAVPVYSTGLKKTGIPTDRIPRVSEMDECLAQFGWGAVPVRGFIPPAAFLDFQARAVLPIACDMRTVNHIAYTPAPDIVHEAAGHAPIIADPAYSNYLHRYAEMAQKSIHSIEDVRLYEAIRYLSDVKENPDKSQEEIQSAEERFRVTKNSIKGLSETAQVIRMSWWTVEYGLVGDLKSPKIYGAGLLSSVGESQSCLSDKVKKIPLTVDCVHTAYDITEKQPQLFVTPTLDHLVTVLEDLEKTMAYVLGGETGLKRATEAQTVNTLVLESGLEISGKFTTYEKGPDDQIIFVKLAGPVQLARERSELPGQGRARHPDGFSTPLGRWTLDPSRSPSSFTQSDLNKWGLKLGQKFKLQLVNGFLIEGILEGACFENGKLLYLTWNQCRVSRLGNMYYDPAWGLFDMAVGEKVVSVYGGPASWSTYGMAGVGDATTSPARTSPFSAIEKSLFKHYGVLRQMRQGMMKDKKQIESELKNLAQIVSKELHQEWLLALEIIELQQQKLGFEPSEHDWSRKLIENTLDTKNQYATEIQELIEKGLRLSSVDDEHIH